MKFKTVPESSHPQKNPPFDEREAEGKLYSLLSKKKISLKDLKMLVNSAINEIPLDFEELSIL